MRNVLILSWNVINSVFPLLSLKPLKYFFDPVEME